MRRTLVLDLDGTLCLGDAPVRRVAHHAFAHLGGAERRHAVTTLDRFLAGEHGLVPAARDAYDATAILAMAGGIGADELHAAFMVTREPGEIDRWLPEVHAPRALVATLLGLDGIERVLVTNSPPSGIERILETLGLARALDDVITNARKPNGMPAILDRLGVAPAVTARELASIGDRWINDLAEVHERGGTTFHISHEGWADGTATHRASEPDALAVPLQAWMLS